METTIEATTRGVNRVVLLLTPAEERRLRNAVDIAGDVCREARMGHSERSLSMANALDGLRVAMERAEQTVAS